MHEAHALYVQATTTKPERYIAAGDWRMRYEVMDAPGVVTHGPGGSWSFLRATLTAAETAMAIVEIERLGAKLAAMEPDAEVRMFSTLYEVAV